MLTKSQNPTEFCDDFNADAISYFNDEPFVRHIKLAGSLGQRFGLTVKNSSDEDFFISQMKKALIHKQVGFKN